MFRLSGVFTILIACVCGTLLFWTSQSVQRAEKKLSEEKNFVFTEKEALRVLTTEWDYLNRPERLEELAKNNLDIDAPSEAEEIFVESSEQIPEPIVPVLPQIKPDNLMQYVSTTSKHTGAESSAPIVESKQGKSFDKLIHSVAEGGTP